MNTAPNSRPASPDSFGSQSSPSYTFLEDSTAETKVRTHQLPIVTPSPLHGAAPITFEQEEKDERNIMLSDRLSSAFKAFKAFNAFNAVPEPITKEMSVGRALSDVACQLPWPRSDVACKLPWPLPPRVPRVATLTSTVSKFALPPSEEATFDHIIVQKDRKSVV